MFQRVSSLGALAFSSLFIPFHPVSSRFIPFHRVSSRFTRNDENETFSKKNSYRRERTRTDASLARARPYEANKGKGRETGNGTRKERNGTRGEPISWGLRIGNCRLNDLGRVRTLAYSETFPEFIGDEPTPRQSKYLWPVELSRQENRSLIKSSDSYDDSRRAPSATDSSATTTFLENPCRPE